MTQTIPHQVAVRSLSLAWAIVIGCTGPSSESSTVERTDSASVTIVSNTSDDRELQWEFQESFRLGGAEDGPETFYRVSDRLVAVDRAGNIYVLDADNYRVVQFDSTGQFIRMFGAQGGGPGEFEWPSQVAVTTAGAVAVYDVQKRALVRFDQSGEHLDQISLASLGLVQRHAVQGDSVVLQTSLRRRDDGGTTDRLILVAAQDTTVLATRSSVPIAMQMYEMCGVGLARPPIFSKSFQWRHTDSAMAISIESNYVIALRLGSTLMSVRRIVSIMEATPELAQRELGDGMPIGIGRTRTCVIPTAALIEQRGLAAEVPAIRDLALAPDGFLWIKRWRFNDEPSKTDVLNPDGEYVGTLTGEARFPVGFLPDGRFLSVATDELDVQRLVVYKIVERTSDAN